MPDRKKIMLVFGTRPEAIKMAPVHAALRARPDAFETLCCVTAQHRELLDQVLQTFGIIPDIDLDLMRAGQDLTDLNTTVLAAMRPVLRERKPDLILVHGDTTTSMASALAAFYAGIPVGHVEAGLRSGVISAPFPEELNRRIAGMVATYHFAPTEESRANLLAEGCDPAAVVVTGNTVVDALQAVLARIDGSPSHRDRVERSIDSLLGFAWREKRLVMVTCHRRETLGKGLNDICAALVELARAFPQTRFVLPVHRNPAVAEPVRARLGTTANIHAIAALPYDSFLHLLRHCHCALTDSGGLQEEAPVLGKPVLVMRAVTERPEAVAAGGVRLIGVNRAGIVAEMSKVLTDARFHARMAEAANPFGDGTAGEKIAAFLDQTLNR